MKWWRGQERGERGVQVCVWRVSAEKRKTGHGVREGGVWEKQDPRDGEK